MVEGYNSLYWYCKNHPLNIVYNDEAWTQYIQEERLKEQEALKKLGVEDKIEVNK